MHHKPRMVKIYTEQVFRLKDQNFIGLPDQKEARDLV